MTLVELFDSIVGQEPELELNSTSSPELLEKLRKGVLDWNSLPTANNILDQVSLIGSRERVRDCRKEV